MNKDEIENIDVIAQLPENPPQNVPWWEDGQTIATDGKGNRILKEPYYISQGVFGFFKQVRNWLLLPMRQFEPLTCSESILPLIAWGRNIERLKDEPLDLFRKRVKFAFINAKEAGEVQGFKNIFERLGIGYVELHEREDPINWDVINIEVTDSDISNKSILMQSLIETYGRTCRRYRFQVTYPTKEYMRGGFFGASFQLFSANRQLIAKMNVDKTVIDQSASLYVARLN
ncbi:phage tail protein [Vibrio algicola]|uniref:Phage tail protein n=1 Tax=Vibrio algicola TaxID=2662262 RepID=A0A5Q0THH6_9VIBR|nr:phage tail protein [Vibrio algicola]